MKLRFLLSLLIPLSLSIAGCGEDATDCADGSDNDGDGLIDIADPGCALSNGQTEFPDPAACQDGEDNDGDGLIDLEDPGCMLPTDNDESNMVSAQCADGVDNDSDGLIDFPNDPGCALSLADSETDDCPDGANCPECGNGIDDDADGVTDYPDDPGCNNAADNDEFNNDPSICGSAVLIQPLPDNGQAMGTFVDPGVPGLISELVSTDCGGTGEENVYVYTIAGPRQVVISTDAPETEVDTVLYLRSDCSDMTTELGCNDDFGLGQSSTITFDRLEAGTYYIVVDSQANQFGNYLLNVDTFTPEKEPCDPLAMECAPGLVCRLFTEGGVTAASETCENPECSDGEDSDGDALIDLFDPGCENATDGDESDDPVVPRECSDGIDNDSDGDIDYPADLGCIAASDDLEESCEDSDPIVDVLASPLTGTTAGSTNDFIPTCSTGSTAGEVAHKLLIDVDLDSLVISTDGSSYDTVLSLNALECSSTDSVACNDDGGEGSRSLITVPNPPQGLYYVLVDGFSANTGAYILNVQGTITPGGSCNPASTLFACSVGEACDGGTNTCVLAACNDGMDNDGDTFTDFPNDPGCDSISDNDETDDCPTGPNCPQCSNGVDDDSDTFIDYPLDIGCESAADNLEVDDCSPGVPLLALGDMGVTGTTEASGNSDTASTCNTSTLSSEDEYSYRVTRDFESLSFSTLGSTGDTVLSVRRGSCDDVADEIACANDALGESVTINDPVNGEFLFVIVDGDFTSAISYVLNVSGTLGLDEACDPVDTQFTCEPSLGLVCNGGTNTCVLAACSDGMDNDGDTFTDFPNDPGCDSPNDNDEIDDCPTGPNCPQCGNGVDDDLDTFTDYPLDIGCDSAADNLEVDDCSPGVPLLSLDDTGATGTTEASGNSDTASSCNTSTLSSEDEYGYRVARDFESISFSTLGSTSDTVLSVRRGDCSNVANEIACANDTLGESVTINDPVNGETLFVIVDGDFTSAIAYVLNVSGTLGQDEPCDPVDTQFTCEPSLGLACDGVSLTCLPSLCSDGIDNDGDTLIDAFDSGCANAVDNDESDDPVPATQCIDGMDNDLDGEIDFPADLGCINAADDLEESCTDSDPILVVDAAVMTGNTSGGTNDFTPICQTTTTAPDHAYEFFIPGELETLTVDTDGTGYDTVVYMRIAECSGADLACDDDGGAGLQSLFTETDVPAGLYYIIVDAFQANAGAYILNVNGVIKAGEACDPTQIAAGFLSCTGATTCTANICQ